MNRVDEHSLFLERHHGADAQKGWNYQIVATARAAFELDAVAGSQWTARLEGIEDFDVVSIQQYEFQPSLRYVQAKTSSDGLDWTTTSKVLASFVRDAQCSPAARFLLITNRPLTGKSQDCVRFRHLDDGSEKDAILHTTIQRIRRTFKEQHRDAIPVTEDLVRHVLDNLDVEIFDNIALTDLAVDLVQKRYVLTAKDAETYVHYVAGRLFRCAKDRQVVNHDTLARWKLDCDLAGQHVREMAAIQRHLVRSLIWTSDKQPKDFAEGRQTRPGHVFDKLDVIRTKWIDSISQAFCRSTCVVVRAPSGQGKSTLAFRYVLDRWANTTVVEVVGASSRADAEAIVEYLGQLQEAYADVRVLIDNADDDVQYWPIVASKCQAIEIPVLVTTRTEDWYRHARPDIIGAAIVEPFLDGDEAAQLFSQLQQREQVFDTHQTAEDAFEKVRSSGLLMEFVYYVTHGTMLTDKLEQQLRAIEAKPNAKDTLSLLLSVSLANLLDCDLEKDRLVGNDSEDRLLRGRLLNSLNGEYITVHEHSVCGLHSVRSRHIVEAFHENKAALATRALSLLPLVPGEEVSRFVLRATEYDMIDEQVFLDGLPAAIGGTGPSVVSSALDALHDIGERHLVKANMSLFAEAVQVGGAQGPDMLTWFISPVDGSAIADSFETSLHPPPEAIFWSLKSLASGIDQSRRGADFCREMLGHLDSSGLLSLDASDLTGTGHLLQWCGTLGFRPKDFTPQIAQLLDSLSLASTDLDALADFSTGLFVWDSGLFRQWMDQHADEILEIYMRSTSCTCVSLDEGELHILFVTGLPGSSPSNDESMDRLQIGRALFPHCSKYCAQGICVDAMVKSILPNDPTTKAIPAKNLPLGHDIWRNRSQARAIWSYFAEVTNAKYLSVWTEVREAVLAQCKDIVDTIYMMLQTGRSQMDVFGSTAERIRSIIRYALWVTPEQIRDDTSSTLKSSPENAWNNALESFSKCLSDVAAGQSNRIAALLMTATDVVQRLQPMQESLQSRSLLGFERLKQLSDKELPAYPAMLSALRAALMDFPPMRVHSPQSYIAESEDRAIKKVLFQCQHLAETCRARGVSIIPPTTVNINADIVTFPLGIDVPDITKFWTNEGRIVIEELFSTSYNGGLWLVPLVEGATADDSGYRIYTSMAHELLEGHPHMRVMSKVPSSLLRALPVPSGTEPLAITASGACIIATFCLLTLKDLLSKIDSPPSCGGAQQHINAAPFVDAVAIVTACYRDSLEQQLDRLQRHRDSHIELGVQLTEAVDYVSAVLGVLSMTTASVDRSKWLSTTTNALSLIRGIPMMSDLLVGEDGPDR